MSSDLLATLLAEASRIILEKVKSGKRITPEEIMLLQLDLIYNEVRETRRELLEQIATLSRRMDRMYEELSRRIDAVRAELAKKIDETNRRIDELYKLLISTGKKPQ